MWHQVQDSEFFDQVARYFWKVEAYCGDVEGITLTLS